MSGANPAPSSSGVKPERSKATSSTAAKSPTSKRRTSYAREAASRNLSTFRQNREYQVAPGPAKESPAKRQKTRTSEKAKEETQETTKFTSKVFFGRVGDKPNEKPLWKPSIVVGSPLCLKGEDLSRIELADRKVAQRRALLDHYGDITNISELLREAIEERNKLDGDDEENTKPLSSLPSTHQRAVETRVTHLREVLKLSEFLPERQNILAAISGYESGQIPYSEVYTLIWGGHIVDTSPDYSSFTRDRMARLDRYHEQYGDGWLWYEPPLKGQTPAHGPAAHTLAQKALCISTQDSQFGTAGIGHYNVEMGFQRRLEAVARYSMPPNWDPSAQVSSGPGKRRRRSLRVHQKKNQSTATAIHNRTPTMPMPDAPRIYLECLLDSGATIPMIYKQDLALIGINTNSYAAQTSSLMNTAGGTIDSRQYELDVGVYKLDPNTTKHSTLVSTDKPIWPSEVDFLGGTMPVSIHHPTLTAWDAPRLSGMLPFMVCYMSLAPGKDKLWLGEDRVDVIGSDRLPGQLRYRALQDDNRVPRELLDTSSRKEWMEPGGDIGPLTKVVFEHDLVGAEGTLREEDCGEGRSFILVAHPGVDLSRFSAAGPQGPLIMPGGREVGVRFVIDPRERPEQKVAMEKRTEKAEKERKRQERRRAKQEEVEDN